MAHFTLLLPFALPPADLAPDLFKQLHTPSLATLLSRTHARSKPPRTETFDAFARTLPHEVWLSRVFLDASALPADSSPALAPLLMRQCGLEADHGFWFILQPVHLHIARDHLVLTDPAHLQLSDMEARALFDSAREIAEESGHTLMQGSSHLWFLRADALSALKTATPGAASGHNIDIWMPHGEGERAWRKLQNEIQMHWFQQDVNREREQHGKEPVNSLWLWGGGESGDSDECASSPQTPRPHDFDALHNLSGWTASFTKTDVPSHLTKSANAALTTPGNKHLTLLDNLMPPALANDWGRWIAELQTLENNWFSPLLSALKNGTIDGVSIVASDAQRLARFDTNRLSRHKFWINPSLTPLCP